MTARKRSGSAATVKTTAATPQTAEPADKLAPATEVPASGALVEPTISDRVETTHPAADDEPRKGLPPESNQIDFNDPTLTPEQAVEKNLKRG